MLLVIPLELAGRRPNPDFYLFDGQFSQRYFDSPNINVSIKKVSRMMRRDNFRILLPKMKCIQAVRLEQVR